MTTYFCSLHQIKLEERYNETQSKMTYICSECKAQPKDIITKLEIDDQILYTNDQNNENNKENNKEILNKEINETFNNDNCELTKLLENTKCPKHPEIIPKLHENHTQKKAYMICSHPDCKRKIGQEIELKSSNLTSNANKEIKDNEIFNQVEENDNDDLSITSQSQLRSDVKFVLCNLKRKRDNARNRIEENKKLEEVKTKMKEFDDSIDVTKYDPQIFDNVRQGSSKAILKMNPRVKLWVNDDTSKFCIRSDCLGTREILFKDIIGRTGKNKKWVFSKHKTCFTQLNKKRLFFEKFDYELKN